MRRYIHLLCDEFVAFYRAFLVDSLQVVADICLGVDEGYQAVLDRKVDIGIFFHLLGEIAFGFDGKLLATVLMLAATSKSAREGARLTVQEGLA